jgi:hypothetical protein
MGGDDDSDDIEIIRSQILKNPDKEFYPGLFDDVRKVNEELAARAAKRKRKRPGGLYQARAELSLKAHLIQQWRRRQQRLKPMQDARANDNSQPRKAESDPENSSA